MDFLQTTSLYSQYQVLATFKTANDEKSLNKEYVAILEGKHLPIYVITYNVEMT